MLADAHEVARKRTPFAPIQYRITGDGTWLRNFKPEFK